MLIKTTTGVEIVDIDAENDAEEAWEQYYEQAKERAVEDFLNEWGPDISEEAFVQQWEDGRRRRGMNKINTAI